VQLVMEAAPAAQAVLSLCKMAASKLQCVDTFELEPAACSFYSQCQTILTGLQSFLEPSLDEEVIEKAQDTMIATTPFRKGVVMGGCVCVCCGCCLWWVVGGCGCM